MVKKCPTGKILGSGYTCKDGVYVQPSYVKNQMRKY